MKILLVAPRDLSFPIGIAYISASLKDAGYDMDCCYYDTPNSLLQRRGEKYDFLATGGMALHFNQLKRITAIAKGTGTKVIVGGNIITSEPELMSRALGADYAVIGQGEETIIELLRCLENNGDLSRVNGIGYFRNEKFVLTGKRIPSRDINSLPWPDYDSFFDLNKRFDSVKLSNNMFWWDVFDHPREYLIVTARSCPFLCTFCYHPQGEYRQRSVGSIMEELKTVIPKYRINIVSIIDDLFSVNEERVYEFCARFKEITSTLPWEVKWFCQMRVDRINDSMLDEMQKSGCYLVSYGFESYSPTVLKSMKKHISPQQIHNAVHTTLDKRIAIQANFIFGDRVETMETAQETLDFWKDHIEAGINLDFIKPYPDSEIYRYCIEKGIIKDRLDFISNHLSDVLNMTEMSDEEFFRLRKTVNRYWENFPGIIALKSTSTAVTIQCPYCQSISEFKNCAFPSFFDYVWMFCRKCRKRIRVHSRVWKLADTPFFILLRRILQSSGANNRIRKLADTPFFTSLHWTLRNSGIGLWRVLDFLHLMYKLINNDRSTKLGFHGSCERINLRDKEL